MSADSLNELSALRGLRSDLSDIASGLLSLRYGDLSYSRLNAAIERLDSIISKMGKANG